MLLNASLALTLLVVGCGGAAVPSSSPPAAVTAGPTPTVELTAETTAEPTVAATAEPTPEPAQPVVVKGSGNQKTRPFDMPGGDFTVVITGKGESNVIASLVPRGADPFEGEGLFNEISDGRYEYETALYGVAAGSYYLDVTNDGAWTITFTPLP